MAAAASVHDTWGRNTAVSILVVHYLYLKVSARRNLAAFEGEEWALSLIHI